MKRAGFTMIELIFVIVILGILAAVAIPKLAATRDDATLSSARATVNTAISAVPAAYMASKVGTFADSMSIDKSKWVMSADECLATFTDDDANTVTLRIAQSGTTTSPTNGCASGVSQTESNLSLQVAFDTSTASTGTVYTLVNDMNMTDTNITLGGNRVVY